MLKVITGCIGHETNTFSTVLSDLSRFKEMGLHEGNEFFKVFSGTQTIGGAFIEVAEQKQLELLPTIWNDVFAWGLVTDDAFDFMMEKLLRGIESADKVDGVLLQLHGAMVTQSHDGVEGHLLERVRQTIGKDVPIIATLDLHANISKRAVEQASILVGYDTYPHVDSYERGLEAANLMFRMLNHEIKPSAVLEKPLMMPSPQKQKTNYFPMKAIMDLAHRVEEDKRVLNVSILPGFPFSDIRDAGMGIIVTTQDDESLAEEKAKQIADYAWSLRRHFLADVVPVAEAVKLAMEASEGPIVLADQADNPGGGAPCDGTVILRELIKRKAKNVVICVLRDPEAVSKAIEAGVGNRLTMRIGGKTDKLHGDPVEVTGYVKVIADGKFLRKGPMGAGTVTNLGRTVVLDVDGIDFTVKKGETFSLVGESGSGKTTTARLITRLIEPTSGQILFQGKNISGLQGKQLKKLREDMQIIFQNPYASLNSRMTVEEIVGEPLIVHKALSGPERRKRIIELLEQVGLSPGHRLIDRYPHEFSGGQRQRIGIARALALNPKLIIADEPVSALDVSVRAQILNLLQDLKEKMGLTYVLIAHDLAVVRYMSDSLAVMYLGKIMEMGKSEAIFSNPQHPYTQALVSAVLDPDPDIAHTPKQLEGEIPSPINPPKGCRFHTRCPSKKGRCERLEPRLVQIESEHFVACHL